MSDAKGTFTFRVSEDDRAALDRVAARLGCDRGAALRQLIWRADQSFDREGCFMTNSSQFRIRLVSVEGKS